MFLNSGGHFLKSKLRKIVHHVWYVDPNTEGFLLEAASRKTDNVSKSCDAWFASYLANHDKHLWSWKVARDKQLQPHITC